MFGQITEALNQRLRAWCVAKGIPWIEFLKRGRKDTVVERYRARFPGTHGIVCVGVAQEKAKAWTATKAGRGPHVHLTYRWKTVCVNHYHVYVLDPEWGPATPQGVGGSFR